jgi:hypothetical protein
VPSDPQHIPGRAVQYLGRAQILHGPCEVGLGKAEPECASVPTPVCCRWYAVGTMAKSKRPSSHEQTLDELLGIVAIAREELVAVERRLETLRADISKSQKRKDGSGKKS